MSASRGSPSPAKLSLESSCDSRQHPGPPGGHKEQRHGLLRTGYFVTAVLHTDRVSDRKVVVIVDDEPGICGTLQDVFEDEGYEVRCAADGARALEVLNQLPNPPCVVLLDLMMPVLDGNAVYRAMKADPRLRDVAVVITTSDPSNAPAGVLIMKKPIQLKVLIDAVRTCCGEPTAPRR